MKITTRYMTQNDCYKAGRKITVKGIMVHSTATPGVMASAWFDKWNKPDISKCVHAFLDDKEVVQHLPWNYRGWHAGDSANGTHIGFEMCEPKDLNDKEYFEKVYKNAVELCVKLCKEFKLTEKNIICHCEGYKKGIASNHADVMHWFPKHNKDMDDFRADVKKALSIIAEPKPIDEKADPQVKEIQELCNVLRATDKNGKALKVDGRPGPLTKSAVEKLPVIRKGSGIDQAIRVIQTRVGTKVDGDFGPLTLAAVKKWQKTHDLKDDGIVGPKTWAKLAKI